MKKHRILLAICCLTAAIAGSLALWILLSEQHENASKRLLLDEVVQLPLPNGCIEQYRTYQRGGLDTHSSWHVVYTCSVAPETASETVDRGLASQGFAAVGNNGSGVQRFESSNFQVDYDFVPDASSSVTISLTMYRLGRSY